MEAFLMAGPMTVVIFIFLKGKGERKIWYGGV